MPNSHPFVSATNDLLEKLDAEASINTAIDLANEILRLLGHAETKSAEEVFESSIELPNAERYDSWFQPHPIFKSDRACFNLSEGNLFQAKFYWLKKHSRQIIAGGVHFTPNFEDEDFTHNDRYKVGIDFFLSPNGKSLQVILSNRGNLRIVELNKRLNSTQVDIFAKWNGAGALSTQEAFHTTLWESFKLQSVNQKFYDGVSNSFTELIQHLKYIKKDEEEAKLFASRLLGRLLFCWFLRKKGIIDENIGYFDAEILSATSYYKKSLEQLFFLTLNTPVHERDALTKKHQNALFPELLEDAQSSLFKTDQKTPYLNGGLFEAHESDWYGDSSLTLPEGFFTKLYDHFEEFNFTTDESSPEYEQIAIDPEMLGRVFESLLATQVDETGQQARKAKGAFYTPREIVSYMCKETLRNYLYSSASNDEKVKESIDSILDISDSEWAKSKSNNLRDKVKDYRSQIIDSLDSVTILDPACGSGAFPMGMLQLMVRTYERLENRFDPYQTKLTIIQNNIFGVDIEPMAIEIARLRAWLSLIVDEDDPRRVEPLPNLDFKFIAANTLIKPDRSFGLDESTQANTRSKMQTIIKKYFAETDKLEKKTLKADFVKLEAKMSQISMFGVSNAQKQIQTFKPFDNQQIAEFFDAKLMFGFSKENPFDIVIGNPPYIQLQKKGGVLADMYSSEGYATFARTGDIYSLFYERGLELTKKESGLLGYITSNKWMRAGYGEKTRYYFAKKDPIVLIDFSGFKVFESATVDTNILIVRNSPNKKHLRASKFKSDFTHDQSIKTYFDEYSSILTDVSGSTWFIGDDEELELKNKIEEIGTPLRNWKININYGIKTGCNEAFIIDEVTKQRIVFEDSKSADLIKPLLRGRDLQRYKVDYKNMYILATDYDIDVKNDYPSVYSHLKTVGDKIVSGEIKSKGRGVFDREDRGKDWWNLRACAYYGDFKEEKIMWKEMSKEPAFILDTKEYYCNDTIRIMTGEHIHELLAVFNSKFFHFSFAKWYAGGGLGGSGIRFKGEFIKNFPVPLITDHNQSIYTEMAELALSMDSNNKSLTDTIDKLVYKLYKLSDSEISLIEEAIR